MCGFIALLGVPDAARRAALGAAALAHRGPDDEGTWASADGRVAFAHRRLTIIDLTGGHQPIVSDDGRYVLAFNGEIYNYLELRQQLPSRHRTITSDSVLLLQAFIEWGPACLDRLLGMFSFAIHDTRTGETFAARDRFGVKPLYYARHDGGYVLASEIKAVHAAGVPKELSTPAWASYLAFGVQDAAEETFWTGVQQVPAGHTLRIADGVAELHRWYDIVDRVAGVIDERTDDEVEHEYLELLDDTIRLRFRSDVPVGINLSGGLDSSALLATVDHVHGADNDVTAFTFYTGDERYDELPWVQAMLAPTQHPLVACRLDAAAVPDLARTAFCAQDEPYGGIPTLAYGALFAEARQRGFKVLLDGQGLDEQWAGYDYYLALAGGPGDETPRDQGAPAPPDVPVVQGSVASPFRPGCLDPELRALASPVAAPARFGDAFRDTQLRDLGVTKLPRALRYNDRMSMMHGCELREPFLDHRLVELALRQPVRRKVADGETKHFLRRMMASRVPSTVRLAPKRALQTPQREWLRGPLRSWVHDELEALSRSSAGSWLLDTEVKAALDGFESGAADNSVFIWQWLCLGWAVEEAAA